jgi:hypothetical protein
MCGMELATAVQEQLPIVVIVVNDGSLTLIKLIQERRYEARFSAWTWSIPDFRRMAAAFGVRLLGGGFGRDVRGGGAGHCRRPSGGSSVRVRLTGPRADIRHRRRGFHRSARFSCQVGSRNRC